MIVEDRFESPPDCGMDEKRWREGRREGEMEGRGREVWTEESRKAFRSWTRTKDKKEVEDD